MIRPLPPRRPHRVAAILLAAALTIAACSDGDGLTPGEVLSDGTTSVPAGPVGGTGGSTPASVAPPNEGRGGPDTSGPGGAPPGTSPTNRAPGTPSAPPTVVTQPAPEPEGVGAFAPFYLRPAESARIVVDVRSQAGAEPGPGSIEHLRAVLADVSAKPVAVTSGSIAGGSQQWTADAIRALADAGPPQGRDRAVMHLYFLRGGFAESDTVLGVSVRSDVAAIFSDRVDEAAGLVGNRGRIEDAVTMHEAGHLLGLVDLFLRTGRADPGHPGHSRSTRSVMYYAVESTLVGSILDGGPPTSFDGDDLADLETIRTG